MFDHQSSTGQTALDMSQGDMRVTGDINIDDISIGDINVSGISTFEGDILIGTACSTVGFGSTAFFNDNAKAIFGDGEDLKVYHDGVHQLDQRYWCQVILILIPMVSGYC